MIENRKLLCSSVFPRHARIVEVGTFHGAFAEEIYRRCTPQHLWCVDPWQWEIGFPDRQGLMGWMGAAYHGEGENCTGSDAYLEVLRKFWGTPNVTLIREMSHLAAPAFPDDYLDVVYIDANHHYEAVVEDLRSWYPKIRPGGLLSGHDYNIHHVKRAVDEFCNPLQLRIELTTDDHPVSWWVWKPTES